MNALEAEIAITALRATGEFSVLRKLNLEKESGFSGRSVQGSKVGICLDTETTGLNYAEDKIIELGIVAFEYDPVTAEIIRITDRYNGFEDPGRPLQQEIIEITGITDDMVRGQSFDDDQVNRIASQASVVIAHNAAFDRKFVENRYQAFATLPWACTVNQIDWQAERISTRVLEYLLFKFGLFINAHRALDDAEGVLGILLGRLPVSDTPVFKALLDTYAEVSARISAVGAPFDKKDLLKQRGYRWSDGSQGGSKSWWISVPGVRENEELSWLASEVYPDGSTDRVEISRVNAIDRFSVRE
ncbi:MAG: 3'-5' exonuclease [Desulfuromonadaceae bacterium]|nr:3'-5' exonuclease [Desulfuromonadaceae bacterium]MDD2847049.1 3'-5' exonuclease [Desulfuromonadaceae bacterium]MDD4128973.1 3'-5' exonuclease [Desulfuromonadaceae bacterium]